MLDQRTADKAAPYERQFALLMQIPGVDRLSAIAIIAEVGVDLSHWPTARKLAAWAGLCPGNYESAGRAKGSAIRRGNVHLKSALYMAASAAAKRRGSYLKDKYSIESTPWPPSSRDRHCAQDPRQRVLHADA